MIPTYYLFNESIAGASPDTLFNATTPTLNDIEGITQASLRARGHGALPAAISAAWECPAEYYMDGICDCYCGAGEPECADGYCSALLNHCGNMVVDPPEECELGGIGCNERCRCAAGFMAMNDVDCASMCGDGVVAGDEECDGAEFCTSECKCASGYVAASDEYNKCYYASSAHAIDNYTSSNGGKSKNTLLIVLYSLICAIIILSLIFIIVLIYIK